MCKFNQSNDGRRIDPCMRELIKNLKLSLKEITPVACCCGHNKYQMTILVKDKYGNVWDLCSSEIIKRKKRFYRKDADGYYFIPESTTFGIGGKV